MTQTYAKFDNIQILRAVAAITVVMSHAGQTSAVYTTSTSHLAGPSAWLNLGVDLFFVISGFVIYFTTEKAKMSAGEFAVRRLQRIVPLYWLLTIVFFACVMLLPGMKSSAFTDWPKFIASLAFVSGPSGFGLPVIYPGWTLEYEMAFYALTANALVVARRAPWAFVAVLLCAAQLSHWFLSAATGPAVAFLTSRMTLSFLGGIIAGQWAINGRPGKLEGFAFLLAALAAIAEDPLQRAVAVGLPSAFVVYLAVRLGASKAHPWIVKLGDASYAIYLLHVFLIAIVGKVSQRLAPGFNADLLAVAMLFVPVLAGLALHQWVELPVGTFFNRQRNTGRAGLTARAS